MPPIIPAGVPAVALTACALITLSGAAQAQERSFAEVDRIALAASDDVTGTVEALGAYLRDAGSDDTERARAIYRWITANIDYDIDAFRSGSLSWMVGDEVLAAGRAVCDGYAQLFVELAEHSGLDVTIVRGFAKGYGYVPGRRMRTPNHAWNAVRIDGDWRLVDSTWGAGTIRNGEWERAFREYFFLTPPDRFTFTHHPEERRWQLTDDPLTRRQFFDLPVVPDYLFSLGFDPVLIRHAVGQRDFEAFPRAYRHPERRIAVREAPLQRRLGSGEWYFHVDAPGADGVLVTDGSRWHRLRGNGGSEWHGSIPLDPGSWMVYASFPSEEPHVFLEYEVE